METQGGLILLAPTEITHAVLENELVRVVTRGATYLSITTLADLHTRLGASFERVHRRALVNMEHVLRLEPTPSGGFIAHLSGNARVEVSRRSARELRRALFAR